MQKCFYCWKLAKNYSNIETTESKFLTWKWKNVSDNSKANYGAGNEITYNAGILKSSLYDYNDAYVLVTGDVTIIEYGVR